MTDKEIKSTELAISSFTSEFDDIGTDYQDIVLQIILEEIYDGVEAESNRKTEEIQ